jgi:hypothetical protein
MGHLCSLLGHAGLIHGWTFSGAGGASDLPEPGHNPENVNKKGDYPFTTRKDVTRISLISAN